PTNRVVQCQDQKIQLQNKINALDVLRSRLLDKMIAEQEAARARERRAQVGTGDRSAKIRTYNFPQNRVTDHRIHYTVHNLSEVMDGNLDDVINALRLAGERERLSARARGARLGVLDRRSAGGGGRAAGASGSARSPAGGYDVVGCGRRRRDPAGRRLAATRSGALA